MARPLWLLRIFSDYGMLGVLLLLCLACTLGTIELRRPAGLQAAKIVAEQIGAYPAGPRLVIVSKDKRFIDELQRILDEADAPVVEMITGEPSAMRKRLQRLIDQGQQIDVIATTTADTQMVEKVLGDSPQMQIVHAKPYWRSTFLTISNLLTVAKKNMDIALIAVGMTMVIITGGIDLSVGSVVALSAMVAAMLIVSAGGNQATPGEMALCSLAAIAVCAAVGSFSGLMITVFRVPAFVATLAMLWVAKGLAFLVSSGETILLPKSYSRLEKGADVLGIPNTLILMIVVYAIAHVVMSRSTLGRHIYAIGGNRQAARLSGIRVNRNLLIVYTISGAMAGLAGVILASRFHSGTPTYGQMYELYAIAAVVIGGTSLAGGEGKIFGTLIGVLIIAVVQTAMNLLAISTYWQHVTLGMIVLLVVVLDMMKRHGWRRMFTAE